MILIKLVAMWILMALTINTNIIFGEMNSDPILFTVTSEFPLTNIKFLLTPPSTPNGHIFSYVVVISTATASPANCVIISLNCSDCNNHTIGTEGTSVNVPTGCGSIYNETKEYNITDMNLTVISNSSGILPYTNYTIKAQAVGQWGWSNSSIIESFLTSQYKSGPAEITSISDIFPQSTLLMTFKHPSIPNGNVNENRVLITSLSTNMCILFILNCSSCIANNATKLKGYQLTKCSFLKTEIIQQYGEIDNITINITDSVFIKAYQNYTIQIQSINEWGYGDVITREYTTREICLIENFNCTNIQHTAINCTWYKPLMTNFEGYSLTCDLIRYFKIPSNRRSHLFDYIMDNQNYPCRIEVINPSTCKSYSSTAKVPLSPNGFPNHIPDNVYIDFMKNVSKFKAADPTSQIIINLPLHLFIDRTVPPCKFTVVVARSAEQISLIGNINVNDFKDKSYDECNKAKTCAYEIVARDYDQFPSISLSSSPTNQTTTIFNIGLTTETTSIVKQKKNGPLDANTEYFIGFRFYKEGRYGTVYTSMRTNDTPVNLIPIIAGVTVAFLIILISFLLIWFNRERILYIIRGRNNTRQLDSNTYDGNDRDSGIYDNFELVTNEYDNPKAQYEYDNVGFQPTTVYHNSEA